METHSNTPTGATHIITPPIGRQRYGKGIRQLDSSRVSLYVWRIGKRGWSKWPVTSLIDYVAPIPCAKK